MTLHAGFRCKAHIKYKSEELSMKYKRMYWLLNFKLYTQQTFPLQADIETRVNLWDPALSCGSKSNIHVIQRFQNKVLKVRSLTNSLIVGVLLHTSVFVVAGEYPTV